MSGYIVFVRFFVGYAPAFPFERFESIADEAIPGAAEALRREWWDDPVNRDRFWKWWTEQNRQRAMADVLMDRPMPGPPVLGGRKLVPPLPPGGQIQHIAVITPAWADDGRWTPELLDIASAAGWRWTGADEFPPYCISGRYPVARFESKESANDAADALRARVAEAARGAEAAVDTGITVGISPLGWPGIRVGGRDERNATLFSAGPRFTVVSEADFSRPEVAHARERIRRLRGPEAAPPEPTERCLRMFWPAIRETLDEFDSVFALGANNPGATPGVGGSNGSSVGGREEEPRTRNSSKKSKKITKKGGAPTKLIAALTLHHKYADGGCLILEPIGSNKLAKLAGVAKSTASKFFMDQFEGHDRYRVICREVTTLIASLKMLNNEFSPSDLCRRRPGNEDDREDE